MSRLVRFFRMIASLFFEGLEDSIPLERRLAYDRQERAAKVHQMMDKATDVGEAAEMMVQALAEARIQASNIRQEIKGHLEAAKAAAARNDQTTEKFEQGQAAALSDDLAAAEADVAELDTTVSDSLKDKEDAKRMVLEQAVELERLARNDSRLVARVRITEMKQQSLELREALMQLVPEDRDDVRGRAVEQAKKREARVKSRTELVDALWQQKRKGQLDKRTQTTARGAEILEQLQREVGYVPTTAMPAVVESVAQKSASASN